MKKEMSPATQQALATLVTGIVPLLVTVGITFLIGKQQEKKQKAEEDLLLTNIRRTVDDEFANCINAATNDYPFED